MLYDCMKHADARTLPAAVQEEKRKQAVRLSCKGMTQAEIGEVVGVHALIVGRWLRRHRAEGAAALKARQRGRRQGAKQEKEIQRLLIDRTPDQLKLSYALWTRQAVAQLIADRVGIKLPIRTVGEYLHRWHFTPQKPAKRAYEQQSSQVKRWLDETYPAIHAKAKAQEAEIDWGDETGLRNDYQHERGYAPKGRTPVIRLNTISAITNQGKTRFRLLEGGMNADLLIETS